MLEVETGVRLDAGHVPFPPSARTHIQLGPSSVYAYPPLLSLEHGAQCSHSCDIDFSLQAAPPPWPSFVESLDYLALRVCVMTRPDNNPFLPG